MTSSPEPRVYSPADRPEVEVLVDDTWWPGELRAWFPQDDGTWRANVSYRTGVSQQHLKTVLEDHVRPWLDRRSG